MAYKITNLLSTWIKIDGTLLQHGESLVVPAAPDDLKRLERLGAVMIDEVSVAGAVVEPPAPKAKTAKVEP
jgi:hypothetical protein